MEYKKLQHVKHAFKDMKTAKLDIRPIFHIKEKTTRGHIFVSMFSFAIIKEMEDRIYPWLKKYNKENAQLLAFKDIEMILKNIKRVEIKLGENYIKWQNTKLTDIQNEILKALNIMID